MGASKEELLQSIRPGMKLDKAFFMKVYGYEISFPGFSDEAIKALNDAGCSRAREYYDRAVSEYEKKHDEEMKEVAAWYRKELERKWDKKQKEVSKARKQKIQSLTRNELTELCQRLLTEGVITEPEQFVTAVLQER